MKTVEIGAVILCPECRYPFRPTTMDSRHDVSVIFECGTLACPKNGTKFRYDLPEVELYEVKDERE